MDGPLPPILLAMTVVTGLVDSFSYLVLGHVFVANMTGNVVFLAFALAGAPGFSIISSLLVVASFVVGSMVGGRISSHVGQHRGHLLRIATTLQAVPDLTTTVLTLTITGIGADSHLVSGNGSRAGRRLTSVAAMFLGALIGTLTILYVSAFYPLVIALTIKVIVGIATRILSRGQPAWDKPN